MKSPIYWIGIRESELVDTHDFFSGSITIFGSGQNGNYSFEQKYHIRFDYNRDYPAWNQFVIDCAKKIIENVPNCTFMLYDPAEIKEYGSEIAQRTICQNPQSLLDLLDNKFLTRQWLSSYVPILPYWMLLGKDIRYDVLIQAFPSVDTFVAQASSSCGGSGTFLLTKENFGQICNQVTQDAVYAISPYKENSVSPNIHLLIYDDEVLLMPPSIQLIEPNDRGFSYRGADFSAYNGISQEVDSKLKKYSMRIGTSLKNSGYRGICGVDFLIDHNEVFLMEVNARFQSSTFLINRAMKDSKITNSMQNLHHQAFQHFSSPKLPDDFTVPYSFFHYANVPEYTSQLQYIHELLQSTKTIQCVDDGLDWNIKLEPYTYLYKAVFYGRISVLSPERRCRIHVNVGIETAYFSADILKNDLERLKILLLSHGTRLSKLAESILVSCGGFNHEEFDALDLVLAERIYACVPYEVNLSQLSPFCVDAGEDKSLFLSFYGQKVISIRVRKPDTVGKKRTAGGVFYHDITYLTNDRLRVYQRSGCYFKDCNLGCKFCDLPQNAATFSLEEMLKTVDEYRDHPNVRHYLIGGGATAPDDDFSTAIAISKHIRSTTNKPIYLMSLPPQNISKLDELYNAGVTEVAFNLELYDRTLAKIYMPGKGTIPLSVYDNAFRHSTHLWGKTGNVRTIFVVGLEPTESLLNGIEYVARLGVSPILSLFRPAVDTPLQDYLAPSDSELWNIYQQAKAICNRYGIELGPNCPYCEDNTLKVTL